MTQDQIILLLDLKASKERGAASMSCGQRASIAQGLVGLKMIEPYGFGYRITAAGVKYLEKNRRKMK
jgi:hypothetical protein